MTSPPYNIGKSYERNRSTLEEYVATQQKVIDEAIRVTKTGGSICWQVGHFVNGHSQIIPIDILLYPCFASHAKTDKIYLRNRIVWHYEFGHNSLLRFSGRHEVILWFTKGESYTFHLNRLRVPQKYPGKRAYQGPQKGRYSCNPLGKNPGDVWRIPNVKGNHIEKTSHPCQFPIELVDRLIEGLTDVGDLVVDPYVGVGSTIAAAILKGRRGAGCDRETRYLKIARDRVRQAAAGTLKYRPRSRPIHEPQLGSSLTKTPPEFLQIKVLAAIADQRWNESQSLSKPAIRITPGGSSTVAIAPTFG